MLIFFLYCFTALSQKSINDYKYVVVPYQFNFLNTEDKYRVNTLTRHLFNNNGFTAYFDKQEQPEDLFQDRCLAMYADVKKTKSFLATKVQIEIKDCRGEILFTSKMGKTKEKDYRKAYGIAIREAFESVKLLNYSYTPKAEIFSKMSTDNEDKVTEADKVSKAEIERLKNEVIALKEEKNKAEAEAKGVLKPRKVESVKEERRNTNDNDIEQESVKANKTNEVESVYFFKGKAHTLVKKESGFELLDDKNNVVYKLLPTTKNNIFIALGAFKEGVAIQDLNSKKLSIEFYNSEQKLVVEDYQLK